MYGEKKELEFFNSFGGFTQDGTEYEIILDGENRPPAPWINVISNKSFGFTISESGAGYTWAYNSRENKITPWSNDPVLDSCPETIYVRDDASGKITSPVSLGRKARGIFRAWHGFGYSRFQHEEDGIEYDLTVFVPVNEPLKLWVLTLANRSDTERGLTLTYYVEWVLGVNRDQTAPYIVTSYNNEHEYLYARNVYNYPYRKHRAFMFSSGAINCYTGDRHEVLGPKGSVRKPGGLGKKFTCATGVSYDTCGAIQVQNSIPPGKSMTIQFGLGYSDDENEINSLILKYKDTETAEKELSAVLQHWDGILGALKVETSDRAMDILINGWLLYQNISCRLSARTAFYQCGGAYGFRDQLQDAMALVYTRPDILREQIIRSSERQFEEGDVQHWWHPPEGTGVRTRITDDLLWLPYATAVYIKSTGDYSILEERTHYIKGPALSEDQREMMFLPEQSELEGSIYEHCKKAIERIGFGAHGLPLMGGGDWNDGMNLVGIKGAGESVWLGWFIIALAEDFIPICRHMDDLAFAKKLEQMRQDLISAIEEHAWDGEWYLRAFYDDGTKLGTKNDDECRIDSISQSWSIISKAADLDRARRAFHSAWNNLVIEKEGVSLLLTPPFNKTEKNPGYIKKYYPGIRENGGQYTHAAAWLAIAAAMLGYYDKSYRLFTMLNPIYNTSTRKDVLRYEKEPYVMTADISYEAPYTGRGGWSWYTGSAVWMYQGLVKWFLGLRREAGHIVIEPAVPESFGDYRIIYRYRTAVYTIEVKQKSPGTLQWDTPAAETETPYPAAVFLDGERLSDNRINLADDGREHHVTVWLRPSAD